MNITRFGASATKPSVSVQAELSRTADLYVGNGINNNIANNLLIMSTGTVIRC